MRVLCSSFVDVDELGDVIGEGLEVDTVEGVVMRAGIEHIENPS